MKTDLDTKADLELLNPKDAPKFGTYEILSHLHEVLMPKTYLEIGVQAGHSIVQAGAKTNVIGIDPANHIQYKLPSNTQMFFERSDNFFADDYKVNNALKNKKIDMAFIDGMHLFEFVLRDFMNVERFSHKNSIIALHDCIPPDAYIASRDFHLGPWTGDVFKIILILKKYRPDLRIFNYHQVCVVLNLNPENTVLKENYDKIVEEYIDVTYEDIEHKKSEILDIRNVSPQDTKDELNKLILELNN